MMKIALFEPSESFRNIFKTSINQYSTGIEWDEFDTISAKAQKSLQYDYDAIVTSRELKGYDFTALIKFVRQNEFNKETPIFLITSNQSPELYDKAFSLGITDIFTKQELLTVSQVISRMLSFTNCVLGAQILIIEDDIAVSAYYSSVFSSFGLVVYSARSFDEAIICINEQSIELVITDLNLDDGGQGQRIIREMRHNRKSDEQLVPIMVMSVSSAPQYKTCLFYLGIDEYIVKPVLPREICLRSIHLIQKYRIEKKALEQAKRFKKLAHCDHLTGSYNRHGFLDIAQIYVADCNRHKHSLGLLYLDLDNFKTINDNLGHAVGDEVLISIVKAIKTLLRTQDIVCRWGGDEFILVIKDCDEERLEGVAHRVKEEIGNNREALYGVGCSIGLSHGTPDSFSELLNIIDQADKAMYQSKKKRKGDITKFVETE